MAHTHSQRAHSIHSDHTGQDQASHNSHDEEVYNFKRKVDRLHRCLHRRARIREERTPTPSQSSSFENDRSYRQRSKTPPSVEHQKKGPMAFTFFWVKIQTLFSKFYHFLFQFSKFEFCHFNFLSFIYSQLIPPLTICQLLLLFIVKQHSFVIF